MRDKVAILTLLNDNFQVHRGNFVLRPRLFKQRVDKPYLFELMSPDFLMARSRRQLR